MRNAGLLGVVIVTMALAACGVGDDGGGGDGKIVPPDPNPDKIACSGGYTLTGTYTASRARPADVGGCWPVGTWTFTTALDPAYIAPDVTGDGMPDKCPDAMVPRVGQSFSFTVDRTPKPNGTGDEESYTYAGNQTELYRISVSEGGQLECEGGLQLYFDGSKSYMNLQPNQAQGMPIIGHGEYTSYLEPYNP